MINQELISLLHTVCSLATYCISVSFLSFSGAPLMFVLPWITVKYLYENEE